MIPQLGLFVAILHAKPHYSLSLGSDRLLKCGKPDEFCIWGAVCTTTLGYSDR